jgi:hypothetical protein
MTHETISNILSLFTDEPLPTELYCDRYHDAQLKLFAARYGERNDMSLRKFKKVMGVNDTMPLIVTAGIAPIPSDYFARQTGWYYYNGERIRINFVEDYQFDALLTNKIEYPTQEFPIANIQSNYIRFNPITVNHVTFSYYTKPEVPVYAVTYTKGYAEFDAENSSEVLWTEGDIPALIQLILQSFNINATQTEISSKIEKQ